MLLGAVVPDLRSAADAVASDLRQLMALKNEKAKERDRLRADLTSLAEEKTRVQFLIEDKRDRRAASIEALAEEQRRAAALADQATSLKDLIARTEKENRRGGAGVRRGREGGRGEPAGSPAGPPAHLARQRRSPRAGDRLRRRQGALAQAGQRHGRSGASATMTASARACRAYRLQPASGAQVNSPSDGWVVYAGPFRSYGQLLIINAGGGYHVLLAGMERIDVQLGQFVLAGEPVAMMASQRLASASAVACRRHTASSLHRIPQGRDFDRPGPLVGRLF